VHDPPRVLHAPTNTANNPFGLSRAERELGLVSDVVDFVPAHRFEYQADVIRDLSGRPLPVHAAVRGSFLLRAIARYDVFHFNFGQALLPLRARGRVFTELGLLKRLGKVVLVTFQGCDVRPKIECACNLAGCARGDSWRAPNAAAMLRHADRAFFLNPDLRRHLPGARFLPYANIDVHRIEPVPAPDRDEVVVAHLPTDRDVKGTAFVVTAVEELRRDGLPVRLDLVERVPHAEALARMAAADVVVDQLVLGWYGGVSVEAMALGRPVVSRIEEGEPADNPFGDRLPVVRADAATVRERLRELVADGERRARLGASGRAFALAEHDPRRIARRALEGLVPLA
jgi:glycosyltransferase involved in cell wall biosynthesis